MSTKKKTYDDYTVTSSTDLKYIFQAMAQQNAAKQTAQNTYNQTHASTTHYGSSTTGNAKPKTTSNVGTTQAVANYASKLNSRSKLQSTTQRTAGQEAAYKAASRLTVNKSMSGMTDMLKATNATRLANTVAQRTAQKTATTQRQTATQANTKNALINQTDRLSERVGSGMVDMANANNFATNVTKNQTVTKQTLAEKYTGLSDDDWQLTENWKKAYDQLVSPQQEYYAKSVLAKQMGWTDEEVNFYINNYKTLTGMRDSAKYSQKRSSVVSSLSKDEKAAVEAYNNAKDTYEALATTNKTVGIINGMSDTSGEKRAEAARQKMEEAAQVLKGYGWSDDQIAKTSQYTTELADIAQTKADTEKYQEWVKSHGALGGTAATAASVLTSPVSGLMAMTEVLKSYGYADKDAPINTSSSAYYMKNMAEAGQEQTSEDIGNWMYDKTGSKLLSGGSQFLYGVGVSTADSMLSMAIGAGIVGELGLTGNTAKVVANAVTLPSFGASAFTSTLKEDQEAGLGKKNALAHATGTGIAEMLTEVVSLDKLWDTYAVSKAGKASLKWAVTNAIAGAGIEGSEEVASDLIGWYVDDLVNGGLSEYAVNKAQYMANGEDEETAAKHATMDYVKQAGEDFAAGFLSGGASNLMTAGAGYVRSRQLADAVMSNSNAKTALTENALKMPENTTAREIAESKAVEDLTKEDVRKMVVSMESAAAEEQSVQDIVENALVEEGLTESEAKEQAETVVQIIQEGTLEDVPDTVASAKEAENEEFLSSNDEAANVVAKIATGEVNLNTSRPATMGLTDAARALEEKQTAKRAAVQDRIGRTIGNVKKSVSSGVAEVTVNGNNDYVVGFTQDSKGNMEYKLAGNRTADLGDVEIEDTNTKQVLEAAVQMDSVQAANAFLQSYDGEPTETYSRAAFASYTAGAIGHSFNELLENPINASFTATIPESTLRKFYDIGKNEHETLEKKKAAENLKKKESAVKENKHKGTLTDNRTHKEQNKLTDVLGAVAKALDVEIVITDKLTHNEDGNFSRAMGRICLSEESMNQYGTLVHEIMEYSNAYNPEGMQKVFDDVLYYIDAEYGTEWTGKQIKKYQETYRKVEADKQFGDASEEFVYDFMAGLFMQEDGIKDFTNFLDKNVTAEEKKTVLQTIADFFEGIAQKIREFINKNKVYGIKRTALETEAFIAEDLRNTALKALQGAVDTRKSITQRMEESDAVVVNEENEKVFSVSSYETEGRDLLQQWLKEKSDLSEKDQEQMLKEMDNIAKICKEFANGEGMSEFSAWSEMKVERNEDGTPRASVVVNNGEYVLNMDFSTVCKKRKTLDRILNKMVMQGHLNNYDLEQKDIGKINQIIKDHGFEIACGLCFVDTKRYRIGKWAQSFSSKYNPMVESLIPKGSDIFAPEISYTGRKVKEQTGRDLRTVDDSELDWTYIDNILKTEAHGTAKYRMAKTLKENKETRGIVQPQDIYASAGFDGLKENNPKLYALVNANGGTSKPKLSHSNVPYANEIISQEQFTTDKAAAVGGVRVQSFSDFQAAMFFDYVQMYAEMEAKHLPSHAYTKEEAFARLFGLTGQKINMSLVPDGAEVTAEQRKQYTRMLSGKMNKNSEEYKELKKEYDLKRAHAGLDENGNYIWSTETFDFDTAMEIRSIPGYDKNVGTIAVGVSTAHINKLLADPTIDMVIPYHKSGINHVIAKMRNIDFYHDFTNVQNTRWAKGHDNAGKKVPLNQVKFDFYADLAKTNDPRKTASNYVEYCRENGMIPKFNYWADNPNYYKLLIDFRVYDSEGNYAPQGQVNMKLGNDWQNVLHSALVSSQENEDRLSTEDSKIIDEIKKELKIEEADDEVYSIAVPDDEDFGMKAPREEKNDLIAIHNLSEEQLTEQLEMNGFASPSIAIVHASQGHTNFGEISVVLSKDSVDPKKTSLNRVYGADAYTPTIRNGDVSYKINRKTSETLYNSIGKLYDKMPGIFSGDLSSWEYMFNGTNTQYTLKDIRSKGYINRGLKAAFLASEGIQADPEYKTVEKGYDEQKTGIYDRIINTIGETAVRASRMPISQWIREYNLETVRQVADVDETLPKSFQNRQAYKVLRETEKYLNRNNEDNSERTIDYLATYNKVDGLVESRMEDFRKWVDNITEGLIEKKGISNGKDPFTEYGSRRTFEQTHYDWTAENILKYLYKASGQKERGQGLSASAEGIQAVTAKKYSSIAQIKKDAEKRLTKMNQQDYKDLMDAENEKVSDMLDRIRADSGMYVNASDIYSATANIKAPDGIQTAMKKLGYTITRATAESMYNLYREIAELPTAYFEAKPKRVVGTDEIKMVVVPDDITEATRKALDDSGVRWQTYESGNDQDRIAKVNELDDLKFSVQVDTDEDERIFSADQADVNSILAAGLEATKTVQISEKATKKIAREMLKKYESNYSVDAFSLNLMSVFAYIKQNGASRGNIALIMQEVAQPVVEQSMQINPEQEKVYKEFRNAVKAHRIKLNRTQMEEVEYAYDSVKNFRNKTFGKLTIANDGSYLDEIWQELVEESGNTLDPNESDANMPLALLDAVQSMKPVPENVFGNTVKDAAYDLGMDIINAYYQEQAQEAADAKVKERISAEKKKLADARKEWQNKYKEDTRKALEESKRQLEEEKGNALRMVRKAIADMDEESLEAMRSNDIAQACIFEELKAREERKLYNLQARLDYSEGRRANRESQIKDLAERRKQSELRMQIEREWKKLDRMVENPTPESRVPDRLLKSAMDVLALVNLDTESDTIKNEMFRKRLEKLKEQYDRFTEEQKRLNVSEEFGNTYTITDRTMNNIYMLEEIFRGKNYSQIKSSEMRIVLQVIRDIRNEIRASNEMFDNAYSVSIRNVSGAAISEVRDAKQKALYAGELIDGYLTMHLDSKREFRKLSGYNDDGALMSLWNEFQEGQMKSIGIQKHVYEMFYDLTTGKNVKNLENLRSTKEKDLVECGLYHKGKPILVSKAMRLAIIMHAQNDNNLRHICGRGITIPDMKVYGQGKLKKAYNNAVTASYIESEEWSDYMHQLEVAKKNVDDIKKRLKDVTDPEQKALIKAQIKSAEEARDAVIKGMQDKTEAVRTKINSIAEHDLSDYEKKVLATMKEFFWNYSGSEINATSNRMYDYSIARVGKYFPIHTNQDFVSKDFAALVQDARIEGNGSLKTRQVSTAAIYLHDIFQEMLDQTDFVSKYCGFAPASRDMNQVMNRIYQEYEQDEFGQYHPVGDAHTLQQVIRDVWSNHDKDYLVNFMKDINGNRATPGILTKAMSDMRSHYAGATLVANIGVAMKQAASFPTAGAVVGKRALLKSVKDIPKSISARNGIKELEERNPLLWYRSQGNIDEQYAVAQNSWAIKIMPKWMKAVSVDLIGNIDAWTVRSLEYSAKYYVDIHNKDLVKGSEEYWDAVSNTYTKLVTETQPNYTVLERPEILRDPDSLTKQLFMFKTQPLQNMQIMYDAMGECIAMRNGTKEQKKAAHTKLVNAVWSQCAAAFTFAGMSIIANLAYHKQWKYRDDEGNITPEEIAVAIRDGMISNFAGGLVFGDYIYSFLNEFFMGGTNYGIDVSIVEAFNTLTAGISNVKEFTLGYLNAKTTADRNQSFVEMKSAVDDIMLSLAQFTGVPYNSMKNMFNSVVLYSQDISRGIETGVWECTSEMPSVYEKTETKVYGMESQLDLIQNALDADDQEEADRLAQEYVDKADDDSYESIEDVYKQMQTNKNSDAKEKFENGEMTEEEALQYWKDQGLDDTEAYKKLQTWESGGTYGKINAEIENMIETGSTSGTNLQSIIKEYEKNGIEAKDARSSITSKFKDRYLNATGADKAAIKNVLITAFVATGMDRSDAQEKVEKWESSDK